MRRLALVAPLFLLAAVGCIVGTLEGDAPRDAGVDAFANAEPCDDDPFGCAKGTTCWPAVDGGRVCIPSKEYKTKGSDCELLRGATTCADGLICITVQKPLDAGPDTGKDVGPMPTSVPVSLCAPWCDDQHPCPAGEKCETLTFDGVSGRACVPPSLEPPDTGPMDTGQPDTYRPDTAKPDTGAPMDTGAVDDTTVTDTAPADTSMDTASDTASDTADDTAVMDSAMDAAETD